ncbi:BapA prefix-like domain-containing protein [Aliigemmobacter aestuarii]|uniref:BapA prefix-like domain-containing protein n=2 Tax=Aliigemmobacter aestuarii TaxID=1445661 RepID=A0A4S3MVN5_9RHOB|nr:BapA prefix-like domain-containing protein [Gemmobacter aestuarii]
MPGAVPVRGGVVKMAQAIDFAVRNAAGGIVRGTVGGEGSSFIPVGTGESVSLNISSASVVSYERQGADLIIKLTDGSTVTLNGFFNDAAVADNRLYLSSDGVISEVMLNDSGNGLIYAEYGPAQGWDKYSALDDLRFAQSDAAATYGEYTDEPAGMGFLAPGLLGGLGSGAAAAAGAGLLGGAALLGGGGSNAGGGDGDGDGGGNGGGDGDGDGGGDGGGDDRAQPTVDRPNATDTLTTNTEDPRLVVTGTGEPGDAVTVTIGTETKTTTIRPDGTWGVTFPETDFPADGTYRSEVVFTQPDGTTTEMNGPRFVIDMTPPEVEATAGVESAGDVENAAEYADGVTISGEGEAGAAIVVTIDGHSQSTTVAADGTWSVTFTQSQVAAGEYSIPVVITATDALGNQTTINETLVIDTRTSVTINSPVAGDDIVNAAEAAAGVTLTGQAQPGSTVSVEWNGTTRQATVAADGKWSANFPAASIAAGTYAATATVTATDAAGNTATATKSIRVDTEMSVAFNDGQAGGDNTISGAERTASVALTGTAEPGATVQVSFEGITKTVTASQNGTWTATYGASEIRAGTYTSTVTVSARDAAGNVATDSHTVRVDTEVRNFTQSPDTSAVKADAILNGAEAAAGMTVTGTVEPGSTVMVRFGSGTTREATVRADGTWSVVIPSGEIPAGENSVTLTATATDAVGNTSTLTQQVAVDTLVRNLALQGRIAGDDILNAAEAAQGLVLQGSVEPGASVVVQLSNGAEMTVRANSNGRWVANFAASSLPAGEMDMVATVTATDAAGNVDSFTRDFRLDTIAPESPDVVSFSRDASGLRGIGTELTDDIYSFARIDASGASTTVNAVRSDDTVWDEANFRFSSTVPDGSYLVINNSDEAGNTASTLLIVDNTSGVDVDLTRSGLTRFDLAAIDLTFAPDADLTITEQQLIALTGPENSLIVKGDADDTVTATGAEGTGQTTVIGGQSYVVYTLGDSGASLLVDDDINTVI